MPERIEIATVDADYDAFAILVREYWTWLEDRYVDLPGFIDSIGGHQALDAELDSLKTIYGPPDGRVLLAYRGDEVTGAVAMKDLHDGSCEMKRLYVPDRFGGHGTGRRLVGALVEAAIADGFALMRLDTGEQNTEAIAMYESMGFRQCPPHHEYPPALMAHLKFMELSLVDDPQRHGSVALGDTADLFAGRSDPDCETDRDVIDQSILSPWERGGEGDA